MIIPLFPLGAVLFPGGRLPLRIFEARYMDMATACLKDNSPFGICLIASGAEVSKSGSAPAKPHATGTLAQVGEWDMPQLGILNIIAHGTQRFRLLRQWVEPSGLMRGEIALPDDPATQALPGAYQRLIPLLRAILVEMGDADNAPAQPHRFDDAQWVGMRFAEILPIPAAAKQTLLEVDDSVDRLEIIYRFLASKSLLPDE
ncbi:MAG: LON peptidase substrate-binding domain-containing protein [Rhodocyclaceae bacterium]|jgi:Lon protease-like protein|nr:LON peptidase substrate-binding domain-containing protein [Rhodocyclaceae bacterium]